MSTVELCIPKALPAWRFIRITSRHHVTRQQMRELVWSVADQLKIPWARTSVRTRIWHRYGYVRIYQDEPTKVEKVLWRKAQTLALTLTLPG